MSHNKRVRDKFGTGISHPHYRLIRSVDYFLICNAYTDMARWWCRLNVCTLCAIPLKRECIAHEHLLLKVAAFNKQLKYIISSTIFYFIIWDCACSICKTARIDSVWRAWCRMYAFTRHSFLVNGNEQCIRASLVEMIEHKVNDIGFSHGIICYVLFHHILKVTTIVARTVYSIVCHAPISSCYLQPTGVRDSFDKVLWMYLST